MIVKDKVVFVLGAGASSHLGFPLGEELASIICDGSRESIVLDYLCTMRNVRENTEKEEIKKTLFDFQRYFKASNWNSIDRFLQEEENEKWNEIGKLFILANLIKDEYLHKLSSFDCNWYRKLRNMLLINKDSLKEQNIYFLTFNYDCSLEYFFYQLFEGSYSSKYDSKKIIKDGLKIKHVYGNVEPQPWNSFKNGFGFYGGSHLEGKTDRKIDYTNERLSLSLYNIDLIRGEGDEESKKEDIAEFISGAKKIYFLGFAFDEYNLSLLGDEFYRDAEVIGGTTYGMNLASVRTLEDYFLSKTARVFDKGMGVYQPRFLKDEVLNFQNVKVYDYISNHVSL